jgi:peptide/nickel transport system substrate-binding protein/microcin C transport system substrate-binding protein
VHSVVTGRREFCRLALTLAASPLARAKAAAGPFGTGTGQWVHGLATFGEPKYPRGFSSFDYVNPQAPKGGTLFLSNPDRRTSFDKFNPFTVRGNFPLGLTIFVFETLLVLGADEPQTLYGLLAEEMNLAPDRSSISFRLHPQARFSNGDRVTAADVKYSFDVLTGKHSAPRFRTLLGGVKRAVVLDPRTVRFDLVDGGGDAILNLGIYLYIFSPKWGELNGNPRRLDEIVTEEPIATGPYAIARADSGRRLELVLRPDYWGRDLPVTRGMYNFDRVVYRYYSDRLVSIEAFKAGEFDLFQEYSASAWMRQHAGPKWDDGRIVKHEFRNAFGQGLQAYLFNLRRPIFRDLRVRRALDFTYDFEKINLYGLRTRSASLFSNSEFAAVGLPGAGELRLLDPFRAELPPEVFGPPYVPPRTDTGPNGLRENLRQARALLAEAGWNLAPDGLLRNAQGAPFELELLDVPQASQFRTVIWQRNLRKIGITLKPRLVDYALYSKRLDAFDYDMVTIRAADFALPGAADFEDAFGSKAAAEAGSSNYRGVQSRAVDHALAAMAAAGSLDELRDACRALDRIVLHSAWQVPQLYSGKFPVSYWNKFGIPERVPKYYSIEGSGVQYPAWPITCWWIRDAAQRRSARG